VPLNLSYEDLYVLAKEPEATVEECWDGELFPPETLIGGFNSAVAWLL